MGCASLFLRGPPLIGEDLSKGCSSECDERVPLKLSNEVAFLHGLHSLAHLSAKYFRDIDNPARSNDASQGGDARRHIQSLTHPPIQQRPIVMLKFLIIRSAEIRDEVFYVIRSFFNPQKLKLGLVR